MKEQKSQQPILHPLIQQNSSTLDKFQWSSRFSGEEFFFADHRVGGHKVFPGVAYLEMARAAGELAGEKRIAKIKNVVWTRPLMVEEKEVNVHIRFQPAQEGVEFQVESAMETGQTTLHAQGEVIYGPEGACNQHLLEGSR